MNHFSKLFVCVLAIAAVSGETSAERNTRSSVAKRALAAVCPAKSVRQIGSSFFYKNNKPIRAGSYLTAPVIGQNPVITLAGNPGGPRIFGGSGAAYATNGTRLATLTPYSCRADHCSGRVVSSASTSGIRRAAVNASRSASGYIKVSGICVFIPDFGACYGKVDKTRPLCNRIVK